MAECSVDTLISEGKCFSGACLTPDQQRTAMLQLLCLISENGGGGGGSITTNLKAWSAGNCYTLTSATRDSDGVITTATVSWPDGSSGTFTTTSKNAIWLVIDSYTITHVDSGLTATQPLVTRDANGNIVAQPAITVA